MSGGFNKLYLLPLAAVILAIGAYYILSAKPAQPAAEDGGWSTFSAEPSAAVDALPAETAPQTIMIYITGAVANPDVYTLPSDSRVKDAVDAAGGMTDEAAQEQINLSLRLSDEDHIVVPKIGEDVPQPVISRASGHAAEPDTVNINTATSAQLETLPGIGPVIAGNIIAYREANGTFDSVEDIMKVDRIGQKTFEAIVDRITIE